MPKVDIRPKYEGPRPGDTCLGIGTDGLPIWGPKMGDKFSARTPKEWDDEVLRLETKVEETAKIGIELGKELEAAKRELERWRHGKQIEGDYVCENGLALNELKTKITETARKVLGKDTTQIDPLFKEIENAFSLLQRKLKETERAGEDIRMKNGDLVEENKRLRGRLQIDPGGSDKIDELEEAMNQLRARLPKADEAYLKTGLEGVRRDALKGTDKVTISAEGLDWETFSHKYYELLSLARKFNIAIVVLP